MFTHQITSKVAMEFLKLTVNTKNKSKNVFLIETKKASHPFVDVPGSHDSHVTDPQHVPASNE